jgi:hypothetical protein
MRAIKNENNDDPMLFGKEPARTRLGSDHLLGTLIISAILAIALFVFVASVLFTR